MEPQRNPGTAFGRRLRGLREDAGLTQRQLADVMRGAGYKIHQTTVAKIEAGERTVSVDEAAQLADVLGIDLPGNAQRGAQPPGPGAAEGPLSRTPGRGVRQGPGRDAGPDGSHAGPA